MAARVDMTYPERKENASNLASVDESLPIIILIEGERRAAGLVPVSLFSLAIFFTYTLTHSPTLAGTMPPIGRAWLTRPRRTLASSSRSNDDGRRLVALCVSFNDDIFINWIS